MLPFMWCCMQTVFAYCANHDYLSTFTRLINVSKSDATVAKLFDPSFNATVFLPVDRVRAVSDRCWPQHAMCV
jgi:hypothetical protein